MKNFITVSCIFFGFTLQEVLSQWIENCPREVTWSLKDPAVDRSCILMAGTYEFLLPYPKQDGETRLATVSISPNATITGTCGGIGSTQESITLTWPVPTAPDATEISGLTHTVTFTFSRNTTTGGEDGAQGFFFLQSVRAALQTNPREFGEATEPNKLYTLVGANLELLPTAFAMSYFCSSLQDVPLGEGTLRLSHIQLEAFHSTPLQNDGLDFATRSYCFADGLRMLITAIVLVAIIVGTCGFLLVLFLRDFLRRRSAKAKNYVNFD